MELYKLLPAAVVSKNVDEMIDYAERLLNAISKSDRIITPGIEEGMNYLQEALEDIETRAMVCCDPDARFGHKDKSKPFTGYKVHIAETENGFITATIIKTDRKNRGKRSKRYRVCYRRYSLQFQRQHKRMQREEHKAGRSFESYCEWIPR